MWETPSYLAGLVSFFFVFAIMGVMSFVFREERDRMMPLLNIVGPSDVVKLENPASASSDAPYLAIVMLVFLELIVDGLTVVSAIEGGGSIMIGTMLALASFLAAAILSVYRSNFMGEAFLRKTRLERIAVQLHKDDLGRENE